MKDNSNYYDSSLVNSYYLTEKSSVESIKKEIDRLNKILEEKEKNKNTSNWLEELRRSN